MLSDIGKLHFISFINFLEQKKKISHFFRLFFLLPVLLVNCNIPFSNFNGTEFQRVRARRHPFPIAKKCQLFLWMSSYRSSSSPLVLLYEIPLVSNPLSYRRSELDSLISFDQFFLFKAATRLYRKSNFSCAKLGLHNIEVVRPFRNERISCFQKEFRLPDNFIHESTGNEFYLHKNAIF